MAGPYYIKTTGGNTDGTSWANAFTSVYAMLNTAGTPKGTVGSPFAAGEILYIDSACADAANYAASMTITGPVTSGTTPAIFISVTVDTTTFAEATVSQIDTSNGAYAITLDGGFALYGIRCRSGSNINLTSDADEVGYSYKSRFRVAAGGRLSPGSGNCWYFLDKCTLDISDDGNTDSAVIPINTAGITTIRDLVFVHSGGTGKRTDHVIGGGSAIEVSGVSFAGFPTTTEVNRYVGPFTMAFCKLGSGQLISNEPNDYKTLTTSMSCGTANTDLDVAYCAGYTGNLYSSQSIYRTGGAEVYGQAHSWLITTSARAREAAPFFTPWIYGYISSTGAKTFTVCVTNDTALFTDAEAWLEVEVLGTSGECLSSLHFDRRETPATVASNQAVDTVSTWNGGGVSFTHRQLLEVESITVNEVGLFRARACFGVTSMASSRKTYIDPIVTVN